MKKTIVFLTASVGAAGIATAQHFHSDFDEASLGDITGLNIDTPNTDLLTLDSGTVTLNTVNQTLDLASNAANLWTNREGAPFAWVASPVVEEGETWYVQTQLTHTDSPGGAGTNSGWDQAGIFFYSGTPGNNPGSENTGTDQSLFAGINDWNAWTHTTQGFADNNPHSGDNGVPAGGAGGVATFEYRVEVTEGGDFDTYNFFFREDPGDAWTQYGPVDLLQDFDNTAVGVYTKSHNSNSTAATEFHYLTVDVIDPTTGEDTDADSLDDGWELAQTATEGDPGGNLTDLDGTLTGPGPGAGSGDFDGDGLTDLEEYELAIVNGTFPTLDPTLADTDDDGRNDGDEVNGVAAPVAIPPTNPTVADTDGDGLDDGAETNTGFFADANDTGSDPTLDDTDGDDLLDGFETDNNAAGYDPNVDDSASDFDGDASTVAEELVAGTDVLLPDTDGDGFYDGAETGTGTFVSYDYGNNTGNTGSDPLNDDSDGDGLLDGVESGTGVFVDETDTGTDPNLADSDNDTFDDGIEVNLGSDPNDEEDFPQGVTVGYHATGGDWLSAFGAFDIDGDGSLGTDGFIFFGDATGTQLNNQTYDFRVESLPPYLVSHQAGAEFVSAAAAFPNYGFIDNPLTVDGTDVSGGIAVGNAGGAGTSVELVTFEIAPGAGLVRVGILGGIEGNPDGRWDPVAIELAGPSGSQLAIELEADPGGVNAGWVFFDISEAGQYAVSATRRLDIGGVGVGGLTFDSSGGLGLTIQDITYDADADRVTLTWPSRQNATYSVFASQDLIDFGLEVDDSVVSGGQTTSYTFPSPIANSPRLFFRVSEN